LNKVGILSIGVIALIFTIIPNAYAEDEKNFLQSIQDWFGSLFGNTSDDKAYQSLEIEKTVEKTSSTKKAILIDQLDKDFPNPILQDTIKDYFKSANYELDIYTTDEITVDFFKKLPSMNYDFVIIRSHALAVWNEVPSAWIFTGEKYTEDKYVSEQNSGYVSRGVPFRVSTANELGFEEASKSRLFMIGSKLITEKMDGRFPGSVIVLAGCDTMALPELADSFISRGASQVVGWDGLIDSNNNDLVLRNLLKQTFLFENGVQKSVDIVNEELFHIIPHGIQLKYASTGAISGINPQT